MDTSYTLSENIARLIAADTAKRWAEVEALKATIKAQVAAIGGKEAATAELNVPGEPFAKATFYLAAAIK